MEPGVKKNRFVSIFYFVRILYTMPFDIQLATNQNNEYVCAKLCDKSMGPFKCVMCNLEVTHRAGLKTPRHFIHKVRSKCIGNGIAHRIIADGIEEDAAGVEAPDYTYNGFPDIPTVMVESEKEQKEWMEKHEEWVDDSKITKEPENIVIDIVDPSIEQLTLNFSEIENELDSIIDSCMEDSENQNYLKCTDCKKYGIGYYKMFGDEITKKYNLNNIYVCPECMVTCPNCNGVNSIKRNKRYGMCFECDDVKNTWVALKELSINEMGTIPLCPSWMDDEKHSASLELIRRKSMGRKITKFFMSNRTNINGYKKTMIEVSVEKVKLKLLEKKRSDEVNIRSKNQKTRETMFGPEAIERYKRMYDNKRQVCTVCNSFGKRRNMYKYDSIMGDMRWSCKSCVQKCPECTNSCVDKETVYQKGICFDCYCWKFDDDKWNKNHRGVMKAASTGDRESCAIFFRNSPYVKSGKYRGERISHVPTLELDSIVRNIHPELGNMVSIIKKCRKM